METQHSLSSEEINLIAKYRALAKREKKCVRDFADALGKGWDDDPMEQSGFQPGNSIRKEMLFYRHGRG